jgi:hypothetical protein
LNVSGSATVNLAGATLQFGLAGSTTVGTANLLGGTVTANNVGVAGTSTSRLNFNGGTLTSADSTATFLQGLIAATIYSGGASINDGGNAITIAQPLLAPTGNGLSSIPVATGGAGYLDIPIVNISGGGGVGASAVATISGGAVTGITILSPGTGYTSAPTVTLFGGGSSTAATLGTATLTANVSGGLTKLGTGTLTLSGINTYAGGTTVAYGTLLINGLITNNVTVNSGATNGGTGHILGSVTNNAGSYAVFTEGSTLDISNALGIASSGTQPVVNLNLPSNLAAGIYILATNAASGSSGSFNSTPVVLSGSTVAGTVPVIVTTSTAVELVVQPPLLAATLKLTQIKGLTLKVPLTSLATNWTSYYGDAISLTAISATTTNSQTVYQLNVPSLPLASSSFTAYEFLGYANTANTQNDQFTYTIADTHGNTATGTVNIIPSTAAVFGLNYATVTPGVGSATVNFAGLPGYTYEVDRATNLAPAIWVDLGNATAGSNGLFNYTDNFTDLGVTPTSAYYRLVWNH